MSLRAHALAWTVEHQLKRRLGRTLDVTHVRRTFETIVLPYAADVSFETVSIGDITGESVVSKRREENRPRLLYVHGGGFVACSARTHRPITAAFAKRGFDVFAPNYRLAPEHRFPAALDDLLAVWRVLSAQGSASLAGDSAGGNLALSLMLRARAEGLPLPTAAALFSPATDLLGTGSSHVQNVSRDAMLEADVIRELVPTYLGAVDPAHPLASPLYADLSGLPPLLIHVGEREILRDDAVRLASKARVAGITVALQVYPIVPHAWQLADGFLPEARQSIDKAAAFLAFHRPYNGAPAGALDANHDYRSGVPSHTLSASEQLE